MFTGIVGAVGRVRGLSRRGVGARLAVETPKGFAEDLAPGASVAVAGVCLTVAETPAPERVEFDLAAETLARTTLGGKKPGEAVNLERSLRLGEELGGHFVQGHVDGVARVERIADSGGGKEIEFAAPGGLLAGLVEKGSVAADGVSLTVAGLADGGFRVALIPETLRRTTLGALRVGDSVNIETDVLGKYVARLLGRGEGAARAPTGVTEDFLREHGFA